MPTATINARLATEAGNGTRARLSIINMDGRADNDMKGCWMRIGELDDSVGKQAGTRREAMATEIARLGAKLAEPAQGTAKPIGNIADSVRISAEARAAQFPRRLAELPLARFPSPAALVAALKDVAAAATSEGTVEPLARLVSLVRQMAQALPASPPASAATPASAAAAELVRVLLRGPNGSRDGVAALVRELLAALPSTPQHGAPTLQATPFERAAVAVLSAVMSARADGQAALPSEQIPGPLPPALYSAAAGPPLARRGNRARRKVVRELPRSSDDFPDEEERAGHAHLPDSRRT